MTQEKTNTKILTNAYKKWHSTKGDPEVWYDILADTVSWGSQGDGTEKIEFTHPRSTKEEVVGYFKGLAEDWSMEHYIVEQFVAQGDRVIALCDISWTHRVSGKTATMPKADAWRFENGKAVEFMEYFDTHKAICACEH